MASNVRIFLLVGTFSEVRPDIATVVLKTDIYQLMHPQKL